jgi:hypothetical protein
VFGHCRFLDGGVKSALEPLGDLLWRVGGEMDGSRRAPDFVHDLPEEPSNAANEATPGDGGLVHNVPVHNLPLLSLLCTLAHFEGGVIESDSSAVLINFRNYSCGRKLADTVFVNKPDPRLYLRRVILCAAV